MLYSKFLLPAIMIICLLLIYSCNDDSVTADGTKLLTKRAFIEWRGDYAADGCGFFIIIDSLEYKADNEDIIGDEYKTYSGINVLIRYADTHNKLAYYCGDLPSAFTIRSINIIWIKR
jgi:hypothetical protein